MSSKKGEALSPVSILVAVVLLTAATLPVRKASAKNNTNLAAAKATFGSKCAMCHGPDGAGSEVGKSMNVPDLRSSTIQKLPDSELAQVIADGKNGMPSFKGSLNTGQIHDVVAYIRSFTAKK